MQKAFNLIFYSYILLVINFFIREKIVTLSDKNDSNNYYKV